MAGRVAFLDTNGWLALLNASDSLHAEADALWKDLGRLDYSIVVTDWIIAETGNGLARTAARPAFVRAVQRLRSSPKARVVFVTRDLLEKALGIYASRPDKTWGLVDCASFIVMQDRRITEAFTNDRHFHQAGLTTLLSLP